MKFRLSQIDPHGKMKTLINSKMDSRYIHSNAWNFLYHRVEKKTYRYFFLESIRTNRVVSRVLGDIRW